MAPVTCHLAPGTSHLSPGTWHLAHLTWFFETFVLEAYEKKFTAFDSSFCVLCNSYYNRIGDKHPRAKRGLSSRPTLAEVLHFRKAVNSRVLAVLSEHTGDDRSCQLITLGLQHEQQHRELLLTDIKHALSLNPVVLVLSAYAKRWPLSGIAPQPLTWHRYEGGLVEHGFDRSLGGFAFGNEAPRHRVCIAPFELASRFVANGDCIAFITDGDYQWPEFWLSSGWDWVQGGQYALPLYWQTSQSSQ